eukprot:s2784_g1.t1
MLQSSLKEALREADSGKPQAASTYISKCSMPEAQASESVGLKVLSVTTTFGRRLRFDEKDMDHELPAVSDTGGRKLQTGTTVLPTTSTTTLVPASETSCYQDLTEAQQDAVRTLGYSISSWHVCKNPSCAWPSGIPVPNAPCLEVLQWFETSLYTRNWADLTGSKRDALELLGWAHSRWMNMDYPLSYAQAPLSGSKASLATASVEAASSVGLDLVESFFDPGPPDLPCAAAAIIPEGPFGNFLDKGIAVIFCTGLTALAFLQGLCDQALLGYILVFEALVELHPGL